VTTERETFDDFSPGAKEIAGSVGQIVSFDAKVNVGYMKKFRHNLPARILLHRIVNSEKRIVNREP
jgi:hypothetical protein